MACSAGVGERPPIVRASPLSQGRGKSGEVERRPFHKLYRAGGELRHGDTAQPWPDPCLSGGVGAGELKRNSGEACANQEWSESAAVAA